MSPKRKAKGKGTPSPKTTPLKIAKKSNAVKRKAKGKDTLSPKTTPPKIAKKANAVKRNVWKLEVLQKYINQFIAYRALGFRPAQTGVQAGGKIFMYTDPITGEVSEQLANLCAIHALQISLEAVRTLNEPEGVPQLTVQDIIDIWDSQDYRDVAQEKITQLANENSVQQAEVMKEEMENDNWLHRSQISAILDVINRRHSTDYRMAVYHHPDGNLDVEGVEGALVVICHRGTGRSEHYVGYSNLTANHDITIDRDMPNTRYNQRVEELINRGLYRITEPFTGGSTKNHPRGDIGEFVFEINPPAGMEPGPGEIWGSIASGERDSQSIGWVPVDHLDQIATAVPITQGAAPAQETAPADEEEPADEAEPAEGTTDKTTQTPSTTRLYTATAGSVPNKKNTRVKVSNKDMQELVMYFIKNRTPGGPHWPGELDISFVNVVLHLKNRNSNGQLLVRDIYLNEGLVHENNLERIYMPYGIPEIYKENASGQAAAGGGNGAGHVPPNYDDWNRRRLQNEVKRRREVLKHFDKNTKAASQKAVDLRLFLTQQDAIQAAKTAAQNKDNPNDQPGDDDSERGVPLNIWYVEPDHTTRLSRRERELYYRSADVLYLQSDGLNDSYAGIANIMGQPIRIRESDISQDGIPDVPWGIRVPTANPSLTEYEPAGKTEEDVIKYARAALELVVALSNVAEERDAARDLIAQFDRRESL